MQLDSANKSLTELKTDFAASKSTNESLSIQSEAQKKEISVQNNTILELKNDIKHFELQLSHHKGDGTDKDAKILDQNNMIKDLENGIKFAKETIAKLEAQNQNLENT